MSTRPEDILGLDQTGAVAQLRSRIGRSDIAPVRKGLLEEAYAQFGDLVGKAATAMRPAPNQQYGLGFAEAARYGVNKGREFVADWWDRGASGFEDSSNKLPMVRAENGLMSVQVDPRLLDMVDVATLGSMGITRVARGAIQGSEQAIREFLEAGVRSGGQVVAGARSKTANIAARDTAMGLSERMPESPAKRDMIHRATGWWQGKDGQWRYEISDDEAKLSPDFVKAGSWTGRLGDIFQHPKLFEAYPHLRDTQVELLIDPTRPRGGHFDGARNVIVMRAPSEESMRKGIVHEVGHGIQYEEGFAPGGTPESAQERIRRTLENDPYLPEKDQLTLDQAAKMAALHDDPVRAYRHLAGETEARVGEHRIDMTEPYRRARPPYKDFDVPEQDQLVLTGLRDKPVSMSLDPEAGRMPGLPESVALPDGSRAAVEPISDLRRIAIDFMREKGLDPNLTTDEFRRVDPARGKAIADTFEAMKNDPENPLVRASYRALIEDVKGQWDALQQLGYKFSFIEPGMPDPYAASPRLAIEDLKQNKHLWVYPTDAGFGNADAVAQSATNPLLAPTGVKIGGRELVANDLFRIVHDVWGHAKEGVGFRADGEENAWLQHLPTFRPQSRMALTTETRGQNSWLNFGPHGEANRTASSADTVFAPQKVGDLPAWVMRPDGMPLPAGEMRPTDPSATLNIGLKVGENGQLDQNEALAALRGLGYDVLRHEVRGSNTEPTLIAGLDREVPKRELELLSRALQQEAIAQKNWKGEGALFGPQAKKWGPFNEDFFLELSKAQRRRKKGEPTVRNPQRVANPGIYKDPNELVADVRRQFLPESPALKDVFGVTRDDLWQLSQRKGNETGVIADASTRPTQLEHVSNVMTKANENRIVNAVTALREQFPEAYQSFHSWYVMDPAFRDMVEMVGPDEAIRRWIQLTMLSAAESPNMAVPNELMRGTAANMMAEQGRFDVWRERGGLPAAERGVPELATVPGRIGGRAIADRQAEVLAAIDNNSGPLSMGDFAQMLAHKTNPYAHARGTPETGFQTDLFVGDAHKVRSTGLADTRPKLEGQATDVERSITKPELQQLAPWHRNVARKLGTEAVPLQAVEWNLFGPQTGVKSPLGPGALEILADKIVATARREGISIAEAKRKVLLGEGYAGFADPALLAAIAAAAGGGAAFFPLLADDGG